MGEKLKNIVLPVVAYGGLTGILSGFLVGAFNFGARYLIEFSQKIYSATLTHLWALPLFFIGLAALALLTALLHRYVPNVRGSGIPNVEGSVRGFLSYKWLRTLVDTLIGSYISFFAGLPLDESKTHLETLRHRRRRGCGYRRRVQRSAYGHNFCYGRMSQAHIADDIDVRLVGSNHRHGYLQTVGYGNQRRQMVEYCYAFRYQIA